MVGGSAALEQRFGWSCDAGASPALMRAADDGVIVIAQKLWSTLVAFGAEHVPNECCGVGIGPRGEMREFIPVVNVHEQPVTRYEISAADQLRIFQRADDRGWQITTVFHTHPATEPYPSATDIALAGWPDATYLILGMSTEPPVLRGYAIRNGEVHESDVRVS